jgi:hypothetical protein
MAFGIGSVFCNNYSNNEDHPLHGLSEARRVDAVFKGIIYHN